MEPGSAGRCFHPHSFGLTAKETGEYNLAVCLERRGNRFGEQLGCVCHRFKLISHISGRKTE